MIPVDEHFTEAFDRERRGEASEQDLRDLNEHAKTCRSCALELAIRLDSANQLMPVAADRMADAQAIAQVMARLSREKRRRARGAWLLGAAASLVVGAAAAQRVWSTRASSAPAQQQSHARSGPSAAEQRRRPPEPAATSSTSATLPSGMASTRTSPAAEVAKPGSDAAATAAQLFARANQLRRQKQDRAAIEAYRELQLRFGGSAEARQSFTTLGFLLLDRSRAAEALQQFDLYLARGGPGSEDALAGRALALERLGRVAEERASLEALVRRYPGSAHAARAARRLAELDMKR